MTGRVLVLEHGRIALDAAITLPRPRRHGTPAFGAMRTVLLKALGVSEVEQA